MKKIYKTGIIFSIALLMLNAFHFFTRGFLIEYFETDTYNMFLDICNFIDNVVMLLIFVILMIITINSIHNEKKKRLIYMGLLGCFTIGFIYVFDKFGIGYILNLVVRGQIMIPMSKLALYLHAMLTIMEIFLIIIVIYNSIAYNRYIQGAV